MTQTVSSPRPVRDDTITVGQLTRTGRLADILGPDLFAPPSAASLRSWSPIAALATLARLQFTGLVLVEDGTERAALELREGRIVASGDTQHDSDGALLAQLCQARNTDRTSLVRAVNHVDRHGAPLGRTLFNHKLAAPRDLSLAIRGVHRARVEWITSREDATLTAFNVDAAEASPLRERPEAASVHLAACLVAPLREQLKSYYARDLEPGLGSILQRYAHIDDTARELLRVLPLDGRERHPIDRLFDGSYRCGDVLELAIVSRSEMTRLLTLLASLGLVSFPAQPLIQRGEDPRVGLETLLARVAAADHFARLECHWTSHVRTLGECYERLTRQYGTTGSIARTAPEIAARLLALIEEAWSVVGRTESRRSYRTGITEPAQLANAAELLRSQALTAEYRAGYDLSQFDFAKAHYEVALEIRPDPQVVEAIKRVVLKREAARQGEL